MAASVATESGVRVLCLGNDVLADDAFGLIVARELRRRCPKMDVIESMESGVRLLDTVLDVGHVVVVDTVQTGRVPTGTIQVFDAQAVDSPRGGSPHYTGLFDAIELGRRLGMPVAERIDIVAVEAADCQSVGGEMHPRVMAAVEPVVRWVRGVWATALARPPATAGR